MATTSLGLGSVPFVNPLEGIFPGIVGAIVAAPTPLAAVQRILWRQVDTLWSGTTGMRLAAQLYLPSQPNELPENYKRRLARSTLHNFYKSSIQAAVGKVFAEDIHLEGQSPALDLIAQDIDSQGQNISQFSKTVLADAINHGVAYILVDHTRVPQDFDNLAEQQASGARPYWVSIPATKVLDARSVDFGGSQRLGYFRYEEQIWEASSDGFTGATISQVRIFKQDPGTPVMFAVYRQTLGKQWALVDAGVLNIPAIPIVPVYANRTGFFMGKPPLQDLADVNVQHWQCASDYQNSVHVASIPFLLTKGLQAQMDADGNLKQLTVDVNAGVVATDPNATVEWVEVSGAALQAARANLEGLESMMEKMGTTLCTTTPGGITATETAVNSAESNSIVKTWALALQDAINGAMFFTAQYIGDASAVKADVNVDFAVDDAEAATMADVLEMHKQGVLDAETVIAEAQRRGILDPDEEIEPANETPATEAAEQPEQSIE